MPIPKSTALFILMLVVTACANASLVTIGNGVAYEGAVTFNPNTSDLLFFFDQTNFLSTMGSPVITTQLFDGSTLLGTYTQTCASTFQGMFESIGSQYTGTWSCGPAPTPVSFNGINSGTIQGLMVVTATGGTATFDTTDPIYLYDSTSAGPDSYGGSWHMATETFSVVNTVPEPGTLAFVLPAAAGLVIRRRVRQRI